MSYMKAGTFRGLRRFLFTGGLCRLRVQMIACFTSQSWYYPCNPSFKYPWT